MSENVVLILGINISRLISQSPRTAQSVGQQIFKLGVSAARRFSEDYFVESARQLCRHGSGLLLFGDQLQSVVNVSCRNHFSPAEQHL